MSFSKLILSVFFSVALLFASNNQYKSGETLVLAENDSIAGDLFFGGRYLEIEGETFGDIVVGAQKSIITGRVQDDMYAWSEEIRINGEVGDLLLGFAKEIIIKGTVHGDVIAYAGSVHILDGAVIKGDLYVGTGYLYVEDATIMGKVKGGGGRLNLNGTFEQAIELGAKEIKFGDNFTAHNTVHLTLHEEPDMPIENAPENLTYDVKPVHRFFASFAFYWFFVSALVIGFIMLALFPDIFPRLVLLAKEKTAAVAGTGALFLIVTPVAAIFAIMFLPLTFILIALFLILLYISKIFTGYIIGDFIMQKVKPGTQSNRFLVFLIGFIILSLLIKVPFLGFFVGLISAILGCGALMYHLFKLRKNGNVETA